MTVTARRTPATTALLGVASLVLGLAALVASPAPAQAAAQAVTAPAGFGSTPAEVVRSQPIFGGTGTCRPATLSPVSIGSVSTLSGVLGELYSPVVPALNLFVKSQNQCNGLKGHPVRLLLADDQGDPSTAVTAVNRLGSQGVLAFVGNIQPVTIGSVLPALHRLRLPVIGGDASHDTWFTSSILFPQASGPQGVGVSYARVARDELRATRVAHVFCLELPTTCTATDTATTQAVRQLGLTLVASKKVSITAPSYTSQCLELQQKRAQAVFLTLDAASVGRFARSCASLETPYRPRYVLDPLLGAGNERQLLASGIRGAVIPTRTVPWRSAKSPAGAYFQRSIQTYGFSGATGDAASLAWTSGALLVAASAQLDPTAPSTGQLVRALRSVRDNSLGGLTAPLTFGETRPSIPYCSFRVYMSTTRPGFAGATTGAQCTGAYRTPSDPNPTVSPFGTTPAQVVARQPLFGGTSACRPATGSPVNLGSVSTLSGVLGELYSPVVPALTLWVRSQNACNGLNGHVIRLSLDDDQGDPSTAVTAVNRQINNNRVLAFVGNIQPLTVDAIVPIINSKKIPVIGSDIDSSTWFTNPYLFPQASPPQAADFAAVVRAKGAGPLGHVYCLEIPVSCTGSRRAVQDSAAAVGVALKVSKQVSITSPSYTSQCLELQKQGVRTVILTLDAASMGRLANSCRALRPSYRPAYVALPLGVGNEQQFFGAGAALGGTHVPTTAFPWTSKATGGPAAFQKAKAAFGFSGASGYAASLGWTAGALTTAISGHLSAANPTTAQLLQGLYEVRSNRLGGLTGPLSFTEVGSGGHAIPYCWFGVTSNAANTGWGTPTATQTCAAGRLPSDPNA